MSTLKSSLTEINKKTFFRFLTFYSFADKNLIVSSYFIAKKRVFLWGYIRKHPEDSSGIYEPGY